MQSADLAIFIIISAEFVISNFEGADSGICRNNIIKSKFNIAILIRIRYKERIEREVRERGDLLDLYLDNIRTVKHVAEAFKLATPSQLDKEGKMATV